MLLSKSCIYGIRAALLISVKESQQQRRFVPIRKVSEELNLSFHFLTKILQELTEAKIMESFRGPNGGVGLARPANQISLLDIIEAIDGSQIFTDCVLGLPGCGEETPCPLHIPWAKRRDDLQRMFRRATLASLTQQMLNNNLRN